MVQHKLPKEAPSPRLCLVVKVNEGQEYGFNLHAERGKGQFVGAVDDDSPAQRAGLRPGDRIFAVNGQSIVGDSHKEVVTKIKSQPCRCELLVISEEGAQWYQENDIPIDTSLPNILKTCQDQEGSHSVRGASITTGSNHSQAGLTTAMPPHRPRLCRLEKRSPTDEFGFNLHAERGKGHYIGTVDGGGIADKAGLETGQRIVGVNGELIYPTTPHKEVVTLIKREPLATELLVASEAVDRWYTDQGIPYSFENAEVYALKGSKSSRNGSEATRSATAEHAKPNGSVPHSRRDTMEEKLGSSQITQQYTHEETEASNHQPDAPIDSTWTEPAPGVVTEATPDDLLDRVFSALKPPSVEAAVDEPHGETDHSAEDAEAENRQIRTTYQAPAAQPSPLAKTVPLTVPPTSTHAAPRSPESPHPGTADSRSIASNGSNLRDENGVLDIFKLNAKDARQAIRHRKKDPRLQSNMSLEDKYKLISNL